MDNLFTIKQAAFILKVHQLTVRRYIKEQKLTAIKVGGNVRIKEVELQNFQKNYAASGSGPHLAIRKEIAAFSLSDPLWKLNGTGASLTMPKIK